MLIEPEAQGVYQLIYQICAILKLEKIFCVHPDFVFHSIQSSILFVIVVS